MAEERIDALVDIYWKEWDAALEGLDVGEHERLIAAIGAVDTVWDRHLFEHAETFGGAEIGYARACPGCSRDRCGWFTSKLVSRFEETRHGPSHP